jgi:hypothetical protein
VTYTTTGTTVSTAVVTFSGGASGGECDGLDAQVTLTGSGGTLASPVSETGQVGTPTDVATVDFSSDSVSAKDVTGVSVVITG